MKIDAPLPLTVTRAWLDSHDACSADATLFEKIWPEGVLVTRETLADASRSGLNLGWFAQQILSTSAYAAYQIKRGLLYIDYQRQREPLYIKYKTKRDTLYAKYLAKLLPMSPDYETEHTPLYVEFETARAPLTASYMAECEVLLLTTIEAAYEKEANYHEEGQAIATHDHSTVAQ